MAEVSRTVSPSPDGGGSTGVPGTACRPWFGGWRCGSTGVPGATGTAYRCPGDDVSEEESGGVPEDESGGVSEEESGGVPEEESGGVSEDDSGGGEGSASLRGSATRPPSKESLAGDRSWASRFPRATSSNARSSSGSTPASQSFSMDCRRFMSALLE